MPRPSSERFLVLRPIVTTVAIVLASGAAMADFEWTGKVDNDWGESGNWLENGMPTKDVPGCDVANATVTITDGAGIIDVACNGGFNVTVGSLDSLVSLRPRVTLAVQGASRITDLILSDDVSGFPALSIGSVCELQGAQNEWRTGSIFGDGMLVNSGTFEISRPGGSLALTGSMTNTGTVNFTGSSGTLNVTGTITNEGTWRGEDVTVRRSGDGRFVLDGGEVRAVGVGGDSNDLTFWIPFDVESGTVRAVSDDARFIQGGLVLGEGTFTADAGRRIVFDAVSGTEDFVVTGTMRADGEGRTILARDLVVTGELATQAAEGGAFEMGFDSALVIEGDGRWVNTGEFDFPRGTISAESATFENSSGNDDGGVVRSSGSATILEDSRIENLGQWVHESGDLILRGGALLVTSDSGGFTIGGGRVVGTGIAAEFRVEEALLRRTATAPPGQPSRLDVATRLLGALVLVDGGEMRLEGGGAFVGGCDVQIGPGALLTVTGPEVSVDDGSDEGFGGFATTTVSGSGILSIRGGTLRCEDGFVSRLGEDGDGGFMRIGASGAAGFLEGGAFRNDGDLRLFAGAIGDAATFFDGVSNEGVVRTEAPGFRLRGRLRGVAESSSIRIDHAFIVESGGTLDVFLGELIQSDANVALNSGDAEAELTGGTWRLVGSSNVQGSGVFDLAAGRLVKSGAGTTSTISTGFRTSSDAIGSPGSVLVESGTLRLTTLLDPDDEFDLDWRVAPGARVDLAGSTWIGEQEPELSVIDDIEGVVQLAAQGELAPPAFAAAAVLNGGRIRPGGFEGAGPFAFEADVTNTAGGVLEIELAPTDHDRLLVDGSLTLGGRLRVDAIDGFVPVVGQAFVIATASGAIDGAFEEIVGPGAWSVSVDGDEVVLRCEAVPTCASDISNDGRVDASDLVVILGEWGFNPGSAGDLNRDDRVDAADLVEVLGDWGLCGDA